MSISRSGLFAALLLAVLSLSSCCTPPSAEALKVGLNPQQRDWWCWAATTQMISHFDGHAIAQCQSANHVHGTPPNCCSGCTGNCPCWGAGWGASIGDIQQNWTHWNYEYKYMGSELSWSELKKAISTKSFCYKRPVQAVWWWFDAAGNVTSGHVVTITGYFELQLAAQNVRLVFYNDPWPPSCNKPSTPKESCSPTTGGGTSVSTYEAFVQSGNRVWGDSFYAFRYTGS